MGKAIRALRGIAETAEPALQVDEFKTMTRNPYLP